MLTTVLGLALFTLIGIGIRLLLMVTIQQRQQRANRQINERLKTLIAAYKVLGGSFTGKLSVDPTHLRDLHRAEKRAAEAKGGEVSTAPAIASPGAERAARELVAGHPIEVHELVVSLRSFVREALDLEPVPADLVIPLQAPTRPSSAAAGRGRGGAGGNQGCGQGGGGMGGMGTGGAADGSATINPRP